MICQNFKLRKSISNVCKISHQNKCYIKSFIFHKSQMDIQKLLKFQIFFKCCFVHGFLKMVFIDFQMLKFSRINQYCGLNIFPKKRPRVKVLYAMTNQLNAQNFLSSQIFSKCFLTCGFFKNCFHGFSFLYLTFNLKGDVLGFCNFAFFTPLIFFV